MRCPLQGHPKLLIDLCTPIQAVQVSVSQRLSASVSVFPQAFELSWHIFGIHVATRQFRPDRWGELRNRGQRAGAFFRTSFGNIQHITFSRFLLRK